jgi:hypothetical protein
MAKSFIAQGNCTTNVQIPNLDGSIYKHAFMYPVHMYEQTGTFKNTSVVHNLIYNEEPIFMTSKTQWTQKLSQK